MKNKEKHIKNDPKPWTFCLKCEKIEFLPPKYKTCFEERSKMSLTALFQATCLSAEDHQELETLANTF